MRLLSAVTLLFLLVGSSGLFAESHGADRRTPPPRAARPTLDPHRIADFERIARAFPGNEGFRYETFCQTVAEGYAASRGLSDGERELFVGMFVDRALGKIPLAMRGTSYLAILALEPPGSLLSRAVTQNLKGLGARVRGERGSRSLRYENGVEPVTLSPEDQQLVTEAQDEWDRRQKIAFAAGMERDRLEHALDAQTRASSGVLGWIFHPGPDPALKRQLESAHAAYERANAAATEAEDQLKRARAGAVARARAAQEAARARQWAAEDEALSRLPDVP